MNKKNVRKMKKRRAKRLLEMYLEKELGKYIGQPLSEELKQNVFSDCNRFLEDLFGKELFQKNVELTINFLK